MPANPHPSKEQVRAYMHQRVHQREMAGRPPPAPDEIRRQLGWYGDHGSVRGDAFHAADYCIILPSSFAQLATLLAVEWLFLAAGVSLSR